MNIQQLEGNTFKEVDSVDDIQSSVLLAGQAR